MSPALVIARFGPKRHARDAEVEHLDEVAIARAPQEHHVLRLDIAVHDPVGVRFADRFAELQRDAERPQRRQSARCRSERGAQRNAVEVFHGDVQRPAAAQPSGTWPALTPG